MMAEYKNLVTDEERALYGITDSCVSGCVFEGEADGESALKETDGLQVKDCKFRLRYPMWHMKNSSVSDCEMTDTCRAALWYCDNICIKNTVIDGTKALRECGGVTIDGCKAHSSEFGWFCSDVHIKESELTSEYPFLRTEGLKLENVTLNGKYSFQYVENAEISNCVLNTKDAFWHAKNVVVTDSVVKGEYLAWYSENVTFIRCKIIGTQPLCYCKGLTLIDCETEGCDLAFEKSGVTATIKGYIESIKNPITGSIKADSVGQIILDSDTECKIEILHK